MSLPCQQTGDLLDHSGDLEIDDLELHPPGFDLGEVQHVVDDRQQGLSRGLDPRDVLTLSLVQVGGDQQVGQTDHAVHRGPDLVAHGGQEGGLGPQRRQRGVPGSLQLALRLLERRDVERGTAHQHWASGVVAQHLPGRADPDHLLTRSTADPLIELEAGQTLQAGVHHRGRHLPVVGVHQREIALDRAVEPARGDLEDAVQLIGPLQLVRGDVPLPAAQMGDPLGLRELLLPPLQLVAEAPPFGDVVDERDQSQVPAALVLPRAVTDDGPHRLAIPSQQQALRRLGRPACVPLTCQERGPLIASVVVQHLEQRDRRHLLDGVTQHAGHPCVDVRRRTVEIEDPDALVARLDDLAVEGRGQIRTRGCGAGHIGARVRHASAGFRAAGLRGQ